MSKTNREPNPKRNPKRNRCDHHYVPALFAVTASLMISTYTPRSSTAIAGSPPQGQVEVIPASRVGTSTHPLRGMPPFPVSLGERRETKRIRLNPNVLVSLAPVRRDPVLQSSATRKTPSSGPSGASGEMAVAGTSIEGVGNGFSGPQGDFAVNTEPPDTSGAVGDTQYVQWVNGGFAVFDKATGAKIVGRVPGNELWRPLGGNCAKNNDGDPVVQFDKIARRWVLAQFSVSDGVSDGFSQCVAVSTTSDAGGTYHLYEFTYASMDDYPKIGVWPDGYYVSFNMYTPQDRLIGPRVCAYERRKMLQGLPAKQQCFQLSSSFFSLLPADLDGASSALADAQGNANGPAAPPAGTPNYFLNLGNNSTSLNFWKFHVDWNTPANSTFGVGPTHQPNSTIAVAPFSLSCNGSGQDCVPQPGAGNPEKLDTLGERLMFRLAYRRFSDHESLVVNHSVDTGPPNTRTGVRWYELRNLDGAAPTLFQQGTYAPGTIHRWMGSMAMDKAGNIAVGYSISSRSLFAGIRYASRGPGDTLGKLGPETVLKPGGGTQRCKLPNGICDCPMTDDNGDPILDSRRRQKCESIGRWGDYSTLTVDPNDDCTFWYSTEYQKETGAYKWHTRIGSFKLPSCH